MSIDRHGTQNAVQKMFIKLGHWHRPLHVRALLAKKKREKTNSAKHTMDPLSIPDYATKKGRLHRHRYGKKPGDREYYIANQLKKCKKKDFQGIHDRFVRDEQFRNRKKMVETKMFVDKWMILRTKIIPTNCHHKKTTITKVIGGFIQTR